MAAGAKPYFKTGDVIKERFCIGKLLGAGTFGQVFLANDKRDKIETAIKTEKLEVAKRCLCMEVAVMRDIGNSIHVPFIVACGRNKLCRFIVMECLGVPLDKVIKKNKGKLAIDAATQITMQSILAIKEVHEAGFLHRDVKPANFAFGKHEKVKFNLFVYDFGLARIHIIDGKTRKRRKSPGFRGTLRYASLAAHYNNDLGRVDDLVPIFYSVIEMTQGKLPWSGMGDRAKISDLKENTAMKDMCAGLPQEYIRMGTALYNANYKAHPRYDKLTSICIAVLQKMNVDPNKRLALPGLED